MSLSILNNTTALAAQNQINQTQQSLRNTLLQLSSGSRINSGADDAAGLAIADGLRANISALSQSARNASDGVGLLQVADGALSQVGNLLNRAVTLATESANGTVTDNQRKALDAEFTAIKDEIDAIGANTTYNGSAVFNAANFATLVISDGTTTGTQSISTNLDTFDNSSLGFTANATAVDLSSDDLTSAANAKTALTDITDAIAAVAADRGTLGATMNQLTAASNVATVQVQNLSQAEDGIRAADVAQAVANMSKFNILSQTGISALAQANQMQQGVLKLLQ